MLLAEAAYRLASRSLSIVVTVSLPVVCTTLSDADASELIYSPWDKFCFSYVNDLCIIGRDVHLAGKCSTVVVAGAALLERTNESKKTLRVTVPGDARPADGVRISIDGEQLLSRTFRQCWPKPNVCIADYEAGAELIDRLKRGATLVIEATSAAGAPMVYKLPLAGFTQAYDGPPREPKVFEVQSGQLQKELQERAEGKRHLQEKKEVECETEEK
jgi:invasion protein IalB